MIIDEMTAIDVRVHVDGRMKVIVDEIAINRRKNDKSKDHFEKSK